MGKNRDPFAVKTFRPTKNVQFEGGMVEGKDIPLVTEFHSKDMPTEVPGGRMKEDAFAWAGLRMPAAWQPGLHRFVSVHVVDSLFLYFEYCC